MNRLPHSLVLEQTRRRFLQYAGAMAGAIALPGSHLAMAQGGPKHGGTIRIIIEPEPPMLLAAVNPLTSMIITSTKTNEGLLTYDFDLNPQPQLAVEWDVAADGKTYTFKLREGVKWHDGADFTSADVAYSLSSLKQNHTRGRATFANVTDIETPDDHTVILRLSNPAPYMFFALAGSESPIIPKHVYEGTDLATNPAMSAPIGTGPFKFKEWSRGSHIVYERNPDYWDAPKPYLDQVILQFARDASARTIAIETGAVEVVSGTPVPVPLPDLVRLENMPNITVIDDGWQYVNSVGRIEFNLENEYFKDHKVRLAIAHAVDRETILNVACYGKGHIAYGPVSPELGRFAVPELADIVPQLDPAKSEALLDEAGLTRGSDGVRFRVNADFMPNGDIFRRTAEYLKQALEPIGIEVTVRAQDVASYVKRVYTDRDFDFAVQSLSNMYDPTVGVQRLYWSKNFRPGVPFTNGSGYNNPKVDELFEAAAIEADHEKRYQLFAEAQKIIVQDAPSITLFAQYGATITKNTVKDLIVTADGIMGNYASAYVES